MTLFVPAQADRSFVSLADGTLTLNNLLVPVDRTPDASGGHRVRETCGRHRRRRQGDNLAPARRRRAPTCRVCKPWTGDRWTFALMRREGEPVAEILAAAELVGADLIVMPTAGRAGVFEVLRGSTTERVLRQARCPLLAVPASSGT